jgi:hypothetical protein
VVCLSGLIALGGLAGGVGLGWLPLGEPPREDANLIATRSDQRPQRWIVAHLDSKAQGHSMAGRLVAVWAIILAVLVLAGCAVARLDGALSPVGLALAAGSSVAAGFMAGRGRLRGKSLGARDNGTGVAAALIAAELSFDPRLGILITGAEEFGLVGARVFARHTPDVGKTEFINLDTLDDEGNLYLVSHDRHGEHLASDLAPSLAHLELPLRRRRLPLGIFVDSAPLARKEARAITIGRLTWKTLRRIHTTADTPDDLSFTTAQRVGRALALN